MTYSLLIQMQGPSGAISKTISVAALAEARVDGETVPIATDTLVNIAFPYATIKAYVILATCTCTIETNATDAAGGQTIAVTADVPITWIYGGAGSNVFSANVTKMYITAAAAGTIQISVLYDPTP